MSTLIRDRIRPRSIGCQVNPWNTFRSARWTGRSSAGISDEAPAFFIKHDQNSSEGTVFVFVAVSPLEEVGRRAARLSGLLSLENVFDQFQARAVTASMDESVGAMLVVNDLACELDTDLVRMKEEFRAFLANQGGDLDALLDAASVHFQSKVPKTRTIALTEEEINHLLEEDKRLFNE